MFVSLIIFILALSGLLFSAKFFTSAAEKIGAWFKLPPFVIGIFIVGIGTSLPELISGILAVQNGVSEIVPGNIIGANISNILLVTGFAVAINRKTIQLSSTYIYVDLHFLIGSFMFFCMIAYDGTITFTESFLGIFIFVAHSVYLIRGEATPILDITKLSVPKPKFPLLPFGILLLSSVGIFFSAEFTISSITDIAIWFNVPKSIIALTILSLGTTLPELAVNIVAIRKGNAEMAIGNVLGSSIFNTLMIPAIGSAFGSITVSPDLLGFSLPVMAACGLLFYLLTHDKKISPYEGVLLVLLYLAFMMKITVI